MAQCRGTTRKGDRCRRDANPGSSFCGIHQDQEARARAPRGETEWDWSAIARAALGFGVVAAILLLRIRR